MDTQLVRSDTGVHLAFPRPAAPSRCCPCLPRRGSAISGVLRTSSLAGRPGGLMRQPPSASFFTSCISLCKIIIGAGVLGLPYGAHATLATSCPGSPNKPQLTPPLR